MKYLPQDQNRIWDWKLQDIRRFPVNLPLFCKVVQAFLWESTFTVESITVLVLFVTVATIANAILILHLNTIFVYFSVLQITYFWISNGISGLIFSATDIAFLVPSDCLLWFGDPKKESTKAQHTMQSFERVLWQYWT